MAPEGDDPDLLLEEYDVDGVSVKTDPRDPQARPKFLPDTYLKPEIPYRGSQLSFTKAWTEKEFAEVDNEVRASSFMRKCSRSRWRSSDASWRPSTISGITCFAIFDSKFQR